MRRAGSARVAGGASLLLAIWVAGAVAAHPAAGHAAAGDAAAGDAAAGDAAAADVYPAPRFTDAERPTKLAAQFAPIDALFEAYAQQKHIPGMVWGIVVDGRLAHVATSGVQDLATGRPLTPQTAFRIASMTKSFTALAILRLRDEGRLSLDDPVSRWIPEFARLSLPTRDTAALRIRQLLSHSAGFPEDNPWGDQQLAASDAQLTEWLQRGIPFSTPPATRYEYSNYAFALLGRIVARASGMPYERYLRQFVLAPLGMDNSTFDAAGLPPGRLAVGYRLLPDDGYAVEPPLPQGVFDSMGGLITTAEDLGKYVAFQLAAWPPRDDPDSGPVRRSSVREMSQMWTPANLSVRRVDGKLQAAETGYGFGLRIATDCRFEHIVAHGGGLPGYGSYMAWLPDYGVGIFAMATLTYSGPADTVSHAWDLLAAGGGLQRRELPPSPALLAMRAHLIRLWNNWDDDEARGIAAVNLFQDVPEPLRRAEIRGLQAAVGSCGQAGPLRAENWLRGQFNLDCEHGRVGVFFSLAPTAPPALQYVGFRRLDDVTERMAAPTGAPAGVTCTD